MRHSKYFAAGDDESRPPASSDRRGVLLPALRSRKRKQREAEENATASSGRGSQQLTAMEKQVVTLRRAHPDTLLLFECGYRMRIFAEDAENAAAVLGIRAQRHKQFVEASVPVHRTLFHARRLVHAGFKVGVVRQTDSVAMRAASKTPGAQRKPLERCVAEIYTRATIPDVDEGGDDSDDSNEEEDTRTRFIACIVEATVHSKPFFSQSMHEVDEETKRSQTFSEEVQIGVFVHDVHTGETKFDEFEDDGKRQRLQRTLESLDPVEFVLPVGRLSAYTEQLLESFVTAQSDSSAVMNDTFGEEILQSCIRVERIPNEFFEFSLAKETFAGVFPSLDMVKTLVAPNYSSLASPTAAFTGQFYLPAEAHRDLDLFVNSTTKRAVGSLLSTLNHTKTNAGARKLRDWVHTPLGSIPEIMERQKTIESLAFPAGSLSTESLPHRIAYEELTTTILPRSKHLLKYLQQVHLGKATPNQTIIHALLRTETRLLFWRGSSEATHCSMHASQTFSMKLMSKAQNETMSKILCRNAFVGSHHMLASTKNSLMNSRRWREMSRSDLHAVPHDWLVVNSTKKLVRFHPKEIIRLHVQEEYVKEQKDQMIRSLWRQFVGDVDSQVYVVGMNCVEILANLDALCSLATVAQSYPNYTRPEFVDDENPTLEIIDGRHPIIEMLLEGSSYISNSVLMSSSAESPGSLLVVSGPNMGGKTSLLRMCALVVILAQMGSFVPASNVRLSVFDGVYTLMHRSTTTLIPQSRISPASAQELTALGSISRNATKRSLVLIDEIGFGMATHYAEAVGVAQMLYFVETVGCQVVFATHLTTSIQKLQDRLGDKCQTKQLEYHFYNSGEEARDVVTFHYVLKDGIASDSFAIETARRAGIAPNILERAQVLRGSL
ncbi:putative DNA mismatch repair protein Msh3 [Phytophthora cinnamomi]|uniref:putative DNA mismatch repair protein Msh3 n=1 Tax=Phytophthora cinnamomi TaxID=4785 RepID=UPI003559857C|nr:putative DNA mismatch repair protein Msh3 [Phytophthora cinnamomi]